MFEIATKGSFVFSFQLENDNNFNLVHGPSLITNKVAELINSGSNNYSNSK